MKPLLIDNISPYSTGQTGASLTSTAVAPRTETDVALFDEVRNPLAKSVTFQGC
jgi:hypothetical protein